MSEIKNIKHVDLNFERDGGSGVKNLTIFFTRKTCMVISVSRYS